MGGGQEYTGDYGDLTRDQLYAFHRDRILILAKCDGVDLLAMETIPSLLETQVLLEVISTAVHLSSILTRAMVMLSHDGNYGIDYGAVRTGARAVLHLVVLS